MNLPHLMWNLIGIYALCSSAYVTFQLVFHHLIPVIRTGLRSAARRPAGGYWSGYQTNDPANLRLVRNPDRQRDSEYGYDQERIRQESDTALLPQMRPKDVPTSPRPNLVDGAYQKGTE